MPAPPLSSAARGNVETIAKIDDRLLAQRSWIEGIGRNIARFFGTVGFIVAHVVFIAGWFVINLDLLGKGQSFDPYPFPFLGLIVGIEFIFLTTFVLMNQNFQSRREEHWAHLNLQLSLLAEHEVTKNMQMLHSICQHLGLDASAQDKEVKELVETTPVGTLVDEVQQKLGGKRE